MGSVTTRALLTALFCPRAWPGGGSVNGQSVSSSGQPAASSPGGSTASTPAGGKTKTATKTTGHRVTFRMRCSGGKPRMTVTGPDRRRVRIVRFYIDGKRRGTDGRAPFLARVTRSALARGSRLRAKVTFRDKVTVTRSVRAKRCGSSRAKK